MSLFISICATYCTLSVGEISQEEYDRWRYHYPEYDSSQIRAKVPPEGLI